ncbi:MAG: hypothetical protein HOV94_25945 [Saccharothrix sp.]|nr:hypothetical protein [Saccharothrix sp.]
MAGRRRLKAAVSVHDPTTREELILLPGESPAPEVAELITNPDAWDASPVSRATLIAWICTLPGEKVTECRS